MATSPDDIVLEWDQEALDAGSLLYHHNYNDESTSDHFVFTVTDG